MYRILKLNEQDLSKDVLGAEAENRNSQYQEKYNKDLQNVRDIMAGKTVIDSKYNEELDLDTAKAWLKKDYIYLNNLMSYSPEEIDAKLAEDLPDIFGNDTKTESALQEAEDDKEDNVEDAVDNTEATEDLEDIIDQEQDQDENPVEEDTLLDRELDELREILVDLDLNLYRINRKEDTKDVIYIIGKVAEDNNDTLMLVDTKPVEDDTEDIDTTPIADEITEESEDADKEVDEDRFDFVVLPKSFDEINKLNPRWGEDLTPAHEDIVEYLMNCLIEQNPEAAEALKAEKEQMDTDASIEDDIEIRTKDIPVGEEDLKDED